MPPLVQTYGEDLLLIAHSLPQFLEYAETIARYLADMGMSLNVGKCAYATTTCIPSTLVHMDPNNAVAPWVCPTAKSTVRYLGLRLDLKGMASIKEKHVLRCEAILGWCKNTLGPACVPHEVMAAVGGIVRYAAPCLSVTTEEVVPTGVIRSRVPGLEIIRAAAYLLHTPPSGLMVHVVDASIIGEPLRRAHEALYRGIKGPTSHFINLHVLNWVVEGLHRPPRRVGAPHHCVVRQSSHLAAVPLEEPDFTALHPKAQSVHLMLPKEHATLLVPNEAGVLEPPVPSMRALQQVREAVWGSLRARTRVHTPLVGACELVPLGTVRHGPTHQDLLRARDGRLPTMSVMQRWRQKNPRLKGRGGCTGTVCEGRGVQSGSASRRQGHGVHVLEGARMRVHGVPTGVSGPG